MLVAQLAIALLAVALAWFLNSCDDDSGGSAKNPPTAISLEDFESVDNCIACHPTYYVEWSGSMHAYTVEDPVWLMGNDDMQVQTGGALDQFCIQCHSPLAFVASTIPAEPIGDISTLPAIVREGIQCDFCHIISAPSPTTVDVIEYELQPGSTKFGTMTNPVETSAHKSEFKAFYGKSAYCQGCHDIIINGVPTEITFTEWQNSPYSAMTLDCQDCHMPTYTGFAAVGGPLRENLHRHDFIGVDVAFTDFPNKAEQKAAIAELLRNSASLSVEVVDPSLSDSVAVRVTVTNDRTGHNLPTAVFFNRQMWIEIAVSDQTGTVWYESGQLDENGDLLGVSTPGADPDLKIFNGVIYDALGNPGANVFNIGSLDNYSIPPFQSRTTEYRYPKTAGTFDVSVRLLFRPFSTFAFRGTALEQYIPEIPTFEMEVAQASYISF